VYHDAPLARGERADPGLRVAADPDAAGGEPWRARLARVLGGGDVRAPAQWGRVAAAADRGTVVDALERVLEAGW
jgi:hypothetical protein